MAADTFQMKRGNTATVAAYLPAIGEPVYDTVLKRITIGDGVTMGGVDPAADKALSGANTDITSLDGLTTPLSVLQGGTGVTTSTGTGAGVHATSPTLVTPVLGTPASGNLTNCTGYDTGDLAGLGANVATFLGTPTSANLAAAVTGETGSGALVFGTGPTLVTPAIGAATADSLQRGTSVQTGNFAVGATENWIICNGAGTITVTLPAAGSFTGREIMIKTIAAQTVVSASANVAPLVGGALSTAILAATAGKWATLVSNGTAWVIMQAN